MDARGLVGLLFWRRLFWNPYVGTDAEVRSMLVSSSWSESSLFRGEVNWDDEDDGLYTGMLLSILVGTWSRVSGRLVGWLSWRPGVIKADRKGVTSRVVLGSLDSLLLGEVVLRLGVFGGNMVEVGHFENLRCLRIGSLSCSFCPPS